MLEPTRTKFYKYTDLDAPVFKGQYLDFTTMFDALLVNGFNSKTPSAFSLVDNVLTITFAVEHGYSNYSVVAISNADVAMYNRQFRVRNVKQYSIDILVDATFTAVPTNPIGITIKHAPLGFTKKFEATGKRVYTNPNWDVAFKVDDYQHADWPATWSRFARTQFATDYADVDTPLGYVYPNIDPTKITTYPGQTYKWWSNTRICISRYPGATDETTSTHIGTLTRAWYLIGDDKGFYLIQAIWNTGATDRTYYYHNYYGTFKSFSPEVGPFSDRHVLGIGFYKNNVSNASYTDESSNDLMRDSTSSGNWNGIVYSSTSHKTWFRLRPVLNNGQGISGTANNSSNRSNAYEYQWKDILSPVYIEQHTTGSGSSVGLSLIAEARGIKGIMTDLMSTPVTRTEKNSDFTIMSREDNTSLMYITNNRSGLAAIDIVKDWD